MAKICQNATLQRRWSCDEFQQRGFFLSTILGDLNKDKAALRKALPSATIIDGLELISGAGYNAEKAAAVISSGWAFDPVHPSKHVYAKMALNLLEKVAPHNMDSGQSGQRPTDNRKRSWSASNQGGSSSGHSGHSGQYREGQYSPSSASTGGRQTARSQQWKEGGRRDSFRSTHSGGYTSGFDGGGTYDRRYSDGRQARGGGGGGFDFGYRGKFDGGYGRGGRGGGRGGGYSGRF
jgi:hypothetical protein